MGCRSTSNEGLLSHHLQSLSIPISEAGIFDVTLDVT